MYAVFNFLLLLYNKRDTNMKGKISISYILLDTGQQSYTVQIIFAGSCVLYKKCSRGLFSTACFTGRKLQDNQSFCFDMHFMNLRSLCILLYNTIYSTVQ
jgi:hypothetical protein